MAKTKAQKTELVNQYRERIQNSTCIIVFKPQKLNANDSVSVKKQLSEIGSTYNQVKNTLFKIALEQEKLPGGEMFLTEEHAVIFVDSQISESAKIINEFAKSTEKADILGGLLKGKEINASQVRELAELPSKEVLLGQLLSTFNGPLRGLVTVLNGNARELVQVINAIKETK